LEASSSGLGGWEKKVREGDFAPPWVKPSMGGKKKPDAKYPASVRHNFGSYRVEKGTGKRQGHCNSGSRRGEGPRFLGV